VVFVGIALIGAMAATQAIETRNRRLEDIAPWFGSSALPRRFAEIDLVRARAHADDGAYRTTNDHARRATDHADSRADAGARKSTITHCRSAPRKQGRCQNCKRKRSHVPLHWLVVADR
jgi:hypothetical protein